MQVTRPEAEKAIVVISSCEIASDTALCMCHGLGLVRLANQPRTQESTPGGRSLLPTRDESAFAAPSGAATEVGRFWRSREGAVFILCRKEQHIRISEAPRRGRAYYT
jgi:hypothetical protein